MWPKIIQVNANDIYVTGGNDSEIDSEEAGRDPNVLKTTLHISLKDSIISQKADMLFERQAHGICSVNNHIYCIGGISS